MHVLFDKTNSLIEHDTQDEEFEHRYIRKDFSLTQSSMVDNSKLLKVSQVLNSILWKVSREHTSRGEEMPNLIWFKIGPLNLIFPELIWE